MNAVGGYAFGDSAPAARRLSLLAEVFEPTSRAFLAHAGARLAGPPELAVDLGCGPGHSTRLLVSVLGLRRVLGLDQSASFVALAAADAPPGAEFAVHDVTVVPFPCPPAGLLSCRFLLGHLPDPAAALAAWATQLAPGGLLLVEEVERIRTDQPALRRYLELAARCWPPAATPWRSAPGCTGCPTRRAWPAATTGPPRWPHPRQGRPSCSPGTWPCGATTPSARAWPPRPS